jgi:hypothetical protein
VGGAIIRAIGWHPGDLAINLIEQRRHLGRIVGILIRQGLRHYHAAGGINRQMQFAPFPARLRAMFRLQPLARPGDRRETWGARTSLIFFAPVLGPGVGRGMDFEVGENRSGGRRPRH